MGRTGSSRNRTCRLLRHNMAQSESSTPYYSCREYEPSEIALESLRKINPEGISYGMDAASFRGERGEPMPLRGDTSAASK